MKNQYWFCIAAGLLFTTLTMADEVGSESDTKSHEASILIGGSTFDDRGSAFALGLSYEYRLPNSNRLLGVGAAFNTAFYNNQTTIGVARMLVHPWNNSWGELRGGMGVGFETGSGFSNLALQFSLGWTLKVQRYVIVPIVDMTLVGNGGRELFNNVTLFHFGALFGYRF